MTRRNDVFGNPRPRRGFRSLRAPNGALTGNENLPGMQNTARYTRDTSNMRLAMRRDDVGAITAVRRHRGRRLVNEAPGRIGVPQMLTLPVAAAARSTISARRARLRRRSRPDEHSSGICSSISRPTRALDTRALAMAAEFRAWLDGASRRARPRRDRATTRSAGAQRCRPSGIEGMSDLDIRNNLVGLLIGELPTASATPIWRSTKLLNRPRLLVRSQRHGRRRARQLAHLRSAPLSPAQPGDLPAAVRDSKVAGTLRSRRIPAGTMVMASICPPCSTRSQSLH